MNKSAIGCCAILMSLLLSACATDMMKAPCDMAATYCGQKIKINQ